MKRKDSAHTLHPEALLPPRKVEVTNCPAVHQVAGTAKANLPVEGAGNLKVVIATQSATCELRMRSALQ